MDFVKYCALEMYFPVFLVYMRSSALVNLILVLLSEESGYKSVKLAGCKAIRAMYEQAKGKLVWCLDQNIVSSG